MTKLKAIIMTVLTVATIGGAASFATASPVAAQVDVFTQCTKGQVGNSAICKGNGKLFGAGSLWNKILNVLTFLVGAAAVLMIIIGGFRYVLSNGDPSAATGAKNTIVYAVIGLVVAAGSNAIVNFVLTNL